MSILNRFLTLWAPSAAGTARLGEAARSTGLAVGLDEDDGFRRLTGDADRDLSPISHARMRKVAAHLWRTNLIANRLIELPLAFLLAEGVQVQVAAPRAQAWVEAFWNDPINNFEVKLPKKVRELAIFGEQCYPAFVNEVSGHLRLGYLDPGSIETVICDPENPEQPIGIVTARDAAGRARRYQVIVNGPEEVFGPRARAIRESLTDGECFYFKINDLSGGTRGNSDLLAQADWLDTYDQYLFGEIERWNFLRAFMWDVTLKGATPEEVRARAREISPPAPGSVRIHNEAEEWRAETPELQQAESAEGARLFRNHVLGGASVPEHWYGGGGNVNKATAQDMGEPAFKVLAMRQRVLKHMIEEILRYQIYRRLDPTGPLPDPESFNPDLRPRAVFPEMIRRDTTAYAAALRQVVEAASAAVRQELLSANSATALIALIATQLGLEIDAAEELARLQNRP
jgi:hypothetical protein